MRSYNHITVDTLVFGLNDMLSTHASPENVESTPSKKKTDPSESTFAENLQSDAISNSVMINQTSKLFTNFNLNFLNQGKYNQIFV
jgi:hypothetical protein